MLHNTADHVMVITRPLLRDVAQRRSVTVDHIIVSLEIEDFYTKELQIAIIECSGSLLKRPVMSSHSQQSQSKPFQTQELTGLYHCKPLFNRLKILTVFSQYVVASLLHVKENLAAFGTRGEAQDAYRLRKSSQLNTVSCTLGKTRDCFPALAVRMYNCLPQHLKALENRDFECRLGKWSLANPLYSIRDFFKNVSNIA
ncbi:hypothetical protein J6590_096011 [Homalodisca vitripennis]|nr:hypothetical protein J6590_096011 [Homalodisca vitripennis]